jgi:hypothetical protein
MDDWGSRRSPDGAAEAPAMLISHLSREVSRLYDDILAAPLPDSLARLVLQLDRACQPDTADGGE